MPSGMTPLPVGVSVAIRKRSKASCLRAASAQSSVVRRLPAVQTCMAMPRLRRHPLEIAVLDGHRPAVDVEGDHRVDGDQVRAGDREGAGDRGAAGVQRREQAGLARIAHQRHIVVGRRDRAEAGLGEPHAVAVHVVEVGTGEAGLQDDGAAVHAHPPRPVMLEALEGRDRQRLDPGGVLRPARHMHLGGGDRRGGAAVDVAGEIAHGVLARREVAEGDVDLGIDQPRNRRRPAGVDDHVAGIEGGCFHLADGHQPAVVGQQGIALDEGRAPVAGDDGAEIDDRGFHALPASTPSRMRSAPAQS